MITVGIKELKDNPSVITKGIQDSDEYLFISKRGKPVAVAMSLNNDVFEHGFKKSVLINAYKKGDISIGQLAKSLNQTYQDTLKMLDFLGISVLDYDLNDDLNTIEKLL